MDLSSLDETVRYFCEKGIAPSTSKTYQSALRKFYGFCANYSIISPFPVSESMLCYYSSHLACQGLSPQTIKTYLAGIRHMQVTLGLPEPRAYSSLPRLRLVQAGIQRSYSQQTPAPSRVRLPITPAVLRAMSTVWHPKADNPDIVMLWAASVLCFFGFFRAGEITVPSSKAVDSRCHLSWGDVTIDDPQDPKMLKIFLKRSKTDQLGKGSEIFIGRTSCQLCPVAAVTAYMVRRGHQDGTFFMFQDGQPLTKDKFVREVRTAIQTAGLPYQSFAGHSFRIGAAAKAGVEDSTIRMLGRWSSSAFLAYIRTPREQLAQFTRTLATT